ncbi:hypothetical protein [Paenibacillus sp. YN15]|uniref:hypothetical protein n=1 Tax=Paenibacillus sp. YN15 TaxID=1742774 RepID=UPI000DCC1E12|nr:hypothetical protein [Paenibacillus sp. YN15]RAU96840.1 hypothetical protein DQG13_20005 [Paenibacillus sp. YN15]
MAANTEDIKLGPCKVTFDVGGTSPVIFETTQGGVVLTYEETTRAVNIDQYGTTPVKEIVTGRTATIACPIAEYDLAKLAAIIPGASLVTDGTTPTKQKVVVSATNVIDLLQYAKKVKLEPLAAGSTANDAITLLKAAPRPALNYTYSYDNELITNVTFTAYPDATGDLIVFGDETAVDD